LERAGEVIQAAGVSFTPVARRGDFIDEMLAQMVQLEHDLVVVGYNVRSFLEKMIWGSLAARIAHELPAPVLIVRDRRDTIKHVLIGISGGGFTDDCADWGGTIAAAFRARVTLVHATQAPALMYAGLEEVAETLAELLQTDTAEAKAIKRAVTCLNELGIEANVDLVHGLAERELLRKMQDHDIDLLVVGSYWAAPPMQRAVLRNITEKLLLYTRRPVLVVRPVAK
jgi:nucleotide-binding universal stress UspA family protein